LFLGAEEKAKSFPWDALKVVTSVFTPDLGMLDSEREEYATNLATVASNHVAAAKASPASLADARRMLALALQLSPRNKRAVVANFQLSKGVLPEITESNYSPPVFARLILTRGQLLEKQGGAENQKLARYFIQLAAELDPKNEDAVYASEVHRLDHGAVDWSAVTDPAGKKP
jgi:TPR repeat protein